MSHGGHEQPAAAPGPVPAESHGKKNEELEKQIMFAKTTDRHAGLTSSECERRLQQYGKNELAEKQVSPILQFLGYLWGPMPIMIWIAIIIELSKGIAVGEGWEDFTVLFILQFANAIVGYIEERNAGDAIAALKAKLAPQCHVCRDGSWRSMEARNLVPGDLIELKIGDVIPADAVLLDGKPVEVDQAALTGESLPVNKHPWEGLLMGSALKRGEAHAVVVATGGNTFFGKAAGMINAVVTQGRLAQVLFKITMVLLVVSVVLCAIIFAKLMTTDEDPRAIKEGDGHSRGVQALSVVIVILVASIPIAIEVVCTSTLALGSHRLSAKGIIVARLSAIEELAGMTILCSDKTGTLTKNKLELLEPIVLSPEFVSEDVVFYAALASKRAKGNQDAIDFAVTDDPSNGFRLSKALAARGRPLEAWGEVSFEPFNPTDKRTLAVIKGPDGDMFQVAKGAPQVILKMSHNKEEISHRVTQCVQELGDRGYRALGVALNRSKAGEPEVWEYLGILSIYDPPRDDTKATIAAAIENGIEVKMVTGDHTTIAKETCRLLGMGTNILSTEVLDNTGTSASAMDEIILNSHGFAEVMPEHKFKIVERIRAQGHVTGMTGDGVNDAPALKRADIGIAVAGSTDAARAAADLVLTSEGLSVIIDAILESRMIFQRMRNYIIYRIACTIQLLCFFFFAVLCMDPDGAYFYDKKYPTFNVTDGEWVYPIETMHAAEFTLPVISMVIITILNDGCMITISHDEVKAENKPQRWAMMEMTIVATVLGFVACLSSLLLLAGCMHANVLNGETTFGILFGSSKPYVTWFELRTIIYLKVSISDFLTLFSARTRTWFWQRGIGRLLGGAACVAMGTSTILALVWDQMFADLPGAFMMGLRKSGGATTNVWVYCIIWWFIQDAAKMGTYWLLDNKFHFDDPPPPLPNAATLRANMEASQSAKGGQGHGGSGSGGHAAHKHAAPGEAVVLKNPLQNTYKSAPGSSSVWNAVPAAVPDTFAPSDWSVSKNRPSQPILPTRTTGPMSPEQAKQIQAATMSAHSERSVRALQMALSPSSAPNAMRAAQSAVPVGVYNYGQPAAVSITHQQQQQPALSTGATVYAGSDPTSPSTGMMVAAAQPLLTAQQPGASAGLNYQQPAAAASMPAAAAAAAPQPQLQPQQPQFYAQPPVQTYSQASWPSTEAGEQTPRQ